MSTENPVADQGTIRENKLELVERLADDLAHEIKNPLHSMVINLEVLRRRLARLEGEPGSDLLRYAGILGAELERVNRRIDLLLRMVRPARDSDGGATIAEVFEELRELFELECQRHGVRLEVTPPRRLAHPDLPRAQTRQMLLSLVLDTLDRAARGGTLHLAAVEKDHSTRIEISTSADAGSTRAPVHDLGDTSFGAVARSLAGRIGGSLETLGPEPHGSASAGPAQVGFALTLPSRH